MVSVGVITLVSPVVPLCVYMRSKFFMHICRLFCYTDNFQTQIHFNNHNHAEWWFFRNICRVDSFHEIQAFQVNVKILLCRVKAILQ